MSSDCCSHDCNQGRDCPARKAPAGTHWCDKSRQPCSTPYTCSPACKLITANSDGSSPHAPRSNTRATAKWFVVLLIFTSLSALLAWQTRFNF